MTKHKADGLYYVTYEMLKEAGACYTAEMIKTKFNAGRTTKLPITYRNVDAVYNDMGGLYWAVSQMYDKDKITDAEYNRFYEDDDILVDAFMDLLLSRAKREGLVR